MNMNVEFRQRDVEKNVHSTKEMHVKQETFDRIISGEKTLEIRKDVFRVYTGDIVTFFTDTQEKVSVQVTTTYTLLSADQIFENDLYKKWLGNVSESQAREIVDMYFGENSLPHELTVFEFEVISE